MTLRKTADEDFLKLVREAAIEDVSFAEDTMKAVAGGNFLIFADVVEAHFSFSAVIRIFPTLISKS